MKHFKEMNELQQTLFKELSDQLRVFANLKYKEQTLKTFLEMLEVLVTLTTAFKAQCMIIQAKEGKANGVHTQD